MDDERVRTLAQQIIAVVGEDGLPRYVSEQEALDLARDALGMKKNRKVIRKLPDGSYEMYEE